MEQEHISLPMRDSVPQKERVKVLRSVIKDRYFFTSDSVLAKRIGVDKRTLKRFVDENLEPLQDTTNKIWENLKSCLGIKAQDLLNAHLVVTLSQMVFESAGTHKVHKEEKLTERWIACFLKSESPFTNEVQGPLWVLQLRQLYVNNSHAFFAVLAAFYLRRKGLYSVNPSEIHRRAKYTQTTKVLHSKNGDTNASEICYTLNRSQHNFNLWKKAYHELTDYLMKEFRHLHYFEAYEDLLDVLVKRTCFSAAVCVEFGAFLLKSAVDPYAFSTFFQMGEIVGLGALSWWYAEATEPADIDARLWAILEPQVVPGLGRIPQMYVWLEFEIIRENQKYGLKLHRMHQPVFISCIKELRCNTFTDKVESKFSSYRFALDGDGRYLRLEHIEQSPFGKRTEAVLPQTLCRAESNELWLRVIKQYETDIIKESKEQVTSYNEEAIVIKRLRDFKMDVFFKQVGWQRLSHEELCVVDVIIKRDGITIEFEGSYVEVLKTDKIEVPWSFNDNLRHVQPWDEVIPVYIDIRATTVAPRSRKVGFYWSKIDFAVTKELSVADY